MGFSISSEALVKSLCGLEKCLYFENLPESVKQLALQQNPWLTSYYIERSFAGIRSWLTTETLSGYIKDYSFPASPKRIGIITAGNIPLVGFHDVMTSLLCGHIAVIRSSHQDQGLMEWIIDQWISILPELGSRVSFVRQLEDIDYLLATGSNNTARHIHSRFISIPRLVRKNRFSVAVLDGSESEEALAGLCDDILLYNGLGCRNISNLLVTPDFDEQQLIRHLNNYDENKLSSLYLQKLTWERARLELLGTPYQACKHVLIKYSNALDFAQMGIIYLIRVHSTIEAEQMIESYRPHIQCVVNKDTLPGQTQTPAVNEFADDVNTLKLFSVLA